MARREKTFNKISVLKIDKDCHVDPDWLTDYVRLTAAVCSMHGIKPLEIAKISSRRKGIHLYVTISPPVEAKLANRLQWLLGDDCRRVDFNRARIRAGLAEWNKLFEVTGRRLSTIYQKPRSSLQRPSS